MVLYITQDMEKIYLTDTEEFVIIYNIKVVTKGNND